MFLPNCGDLDGRTLFQSRTAGAREWVNAHEVHDGSTFFAPLSVHWNRWNFQVGLSGNGAFWSFFRKKGNQYFNNSDHDIFKSLGWGCPGALYLDDPEIYIMFQCEHCIRDPLVEGVRHFFSSGSRSRFEECFKGFLFRMNYFSDRRVHGWHPWAKCKVHSAGGIQLCSCDCSKSLPFLLSESCMFRI